MYIIVCINSISKDSITSYLGLPTNKYAVGESIFLGLDSVGLSLNKNNFSRVWIRLFLKQPRKICNQTFRCKIYTIVWCNPFLSSSKPA